MATLNISIKESGSLSADLDAASKSIAKAIDATLTETAANIQEAGRANIARAGFDSRWQNAFQTRVYPAPPSGGAVFAFLGLPFAEVFEKGATVAGHPLLWLPLSTTPATLGGEKTTPARWEAQVGKLTLIKGTGHPLLVGQLPGSPGATIVKGRNKGAQAKRAVPLFVGLDSVTIPKKFDIEGICARAAAQIPSIYAEHRG